MHITETHKLINKWKLVTFAFSHSISFFRVEKQSRGNITEYTDIGLHV